jgi:hypothetical protein
MVRTREVVAIASSRVLVEQPGHLVHGLDIERDRLPDARALHLHGDLAPVAQRGAVDLAERR